MFGAGAQQTVDRKVEGYKLKCAPNLLFGILQKRLCNIVMRDLLVNMRLQRCVKQSSSVLPSPESESVTC